MKYDNQWRPSKRHHRNYAPYQRQKLKSLNWETPEAAESISKHYNHWRYRDNWYRNPDYHLEKKLLKKYINKPYNDFLRTWHDRTKSLRKQGTNLKLNYITINPTDNLNTRKEFYVDSNGIIRQNSEYYAWRRKKKKQPIKIVVKEIVEYRLKSDIYNNSRWRNMPFRDILYILQKYLSIVDYHAVIGGCIPNTTYIRLCNSARFSGIDNAIYGYRMKYNNNLIGPGSNGWCYYSCFTDLFEKDYSKSKYRYIYPGTPEYIRYYAEKSDAKADRKLRDTMENSIKIAKHGFDEAESFRGPEYHGGKRKKNMC